MNKPLLVVHVWHRRGQNGHMFKLHLRSNSYQALRQRHHWFSMMISFDAAADADCYVMMLGDVAMMLATMMKVWMSLNPLPNIRIGWEEEMQVCKQHHQIQSNAHLPTYSYKHHTDCKSYPVLWQIFKQKYKFMPLTNPKKNIQN